MRLRINKHQSGEYTVERSKGQKGWEPVAEYCQSLEEAENKMILYANRLVSEQIFEIDVRELQRLGREDNESIESSIGSDPSTTDERGGGDTSEPSTGEESVAVHSDGSDLGTTAPVVD